MSPHASLLDQCFDKVLQEAPDMMARCMSSAATSMQAAENRERDILRRALLAQGWWSMERHKAALTSRFPERLRHALLTNDQDNPSSRLGQMSESSLMALVDDQVVDESLTEARMLQLMLPVLEQPLAMLDARMSSLIGLQTVHAEKNPLRPSVFVHTLRELMTDIESALDVRGIWMQMCTEPLGHELARLYEQLASMLQHANVQEAGYRIRLMTEAATLAGASSPAASTSADTGQTPSGQESEQPAASWSMDMRDLARPQTALPRDVLQSFLDGDHSDYDHPLDTDYYEQVREELRAVNQQARTPRPSKQELTQERLRYREVACVDRPARAIHPQSNLDSSQWGEFADPDRRAREMLALKHRAERVAQVLGLDVVRKLVAQVAGDPLLLAPVREAIVALEPSLLRLAIAEPRYFARDDHPARQWIEAVAQRSFRYNDEFAEDFRAFLDPVRSQVRSLNDTPSENATPFENALTELRQRWQREDEEAERQKRQQLDTVRFAEKRQELADQVAWEISMRPDVHGAPGIVLNFLYDTWSLVVASAQLNSPTQDPDPFGYRRLISQLLWSTQRQVTLRQPSKLFEVVPGMLKKLREGLNSLGKSPAETQTFFDALLKLHEPVLMLRRTSALASNARLPTPTLELPGELDRLLAPATGEQQRPQPAAVPWMATSEKSVAGLHEHSAPVPVDAQEPAHETASDDETGERATQQIGSVLIRLVQGCWVDLHSGDEWLRAQLVWTSQKASLFMFVSHGNRTHTMTRRTCERLITQRFLRLVDTADVTQRALQQITQANPSDGRTRAHRQTRQRPAVSAAH